MAFLSNALLGAQIIYRAARAGQLLPIFSLLFFLQLTLHVLLCNESIIELSDSFKRVSFVLIVICFMINFAGYCLLIALYRYSVQTIFNRGLPPTLRDSLPSFGVHLSMLRPLEIIFRFFTSSWRVLPDVIVLGEVRCGTTSLCQHLADFEFVDCHTPFCLWAHPELDNKETFFFVGHYLGIVTPRHYRMCFPLKITKWWRELKCRIRGVPIKPFLSFDGCAQYLTSPTAPYLIAEAYREAGQKPPILIACVRRPVDQALSWWKYENNAMKWGEGMMLKTWNTTLRGQLYPPTSLEEAISYSQSDHVENMYQRAERLLVEAVKNQTFLRLPQWSVTWPGGQLSAIGRNSCFASNISRYERVFSNSRSDRRMQALEHVSIFPMEFLRDEKLLKDFLATILERLAKRTNNNALFVNAIHLAKSSSIELNTIHRNAGTTLSREEEVHNLQSKFAPDEDNLNVMLRLNGIPISSKTNLKQTTNNTEKTAFFPLEQECVEDHTGSMNESKIGELTALVEWIKTFPQLQYLRDEKENSNSPDLLEDPKVSSSIFDIALEVYDCDGDETIMTHAGEVWDNILSLTRKTSKRKLLDGTHSDDWGVDAKYDALTSLLHGAVSHPDMKVRADYVGRITKMPDQHTQKSLMDMIARQKQEIEGSRKEKKIKRSHAAHDEANTPARRISKSCAPSARKPQRTPFTPKSSRSKPCESDGSGRRSLFTTPQRIITDDNSLHLDLETKNPGFSSPGLGDTAEYEKEVQGLREQNDQLLLTIEMYKRNEELMKSTHEEMVIKYRNEMMKIEAAACRRNEETQEELQGKINRLENDISEMLKQMEASEEAKVELDTMRDEMEVMKHTKSLLDDTSERLNHYKEKLAQLTDIKDALEKEEAAHSRSVDENIRLKNELSSLYSMKRNLDDYKSRAVEAEVRFTEVHDELTKLTKTLNDTANERENLQTMVQSQQEEIENLRRQTRREETDESGTSRVGIGLTELNPEIKEELLRLRNENAQLREFVDKREGDAVTKLELQVEDTNRLAERYKSQFLSTKGRLETTQSDLEKSISREQKLRGDHAQALEESSRMKIRLEKLTLELTNIRQNLDASRTRETMLEEELSSWVEQARALQDRTDEMTNRLHRCDENLENAQSREALLKEKIEDLELNVEKCNQKTSSLSRRLEVQGQQLRDSNELCEELAHDLSEWVEKAMSASDLANDISDNLAGCATRLQESRSKNISLQGKLDDVFQVLQSKELELKEEQQRLRRANTELEQNESIMESSKRREQRLQSDLQSANKKVDDTVLLLDEKKSIVTKLEEKVEDALEEKQQLLAREELLAAEVHQLQANAQKMDRQLACIQHDADTFNQEKSEALRELQKSQEEILSLASRITEIESALEESKAMEKTYMQQTHSLESKLAETEEHFAIMRDNLEISRTTETEAKELLNDAQDTIGDLNQKLHEERRKRATIEEDMKLSCDVNAKMEADLNASIEDIRTKWQKEIHLARGHKQEITRLNEVLNESQSSLSAAHHRENMLHHKIRVLEDKESELRASIEATRETANKEVLEATKSLQASREILNAKAAKDVEELQKKMSLLLEEERRRKRQIESESKEKLHKLKAQMESEVANAKDEAASIIERTESGALVRYQQMQKKYEEMLSKLKEDANRESTQIVRKGKGMLKELKIQQLEEKVQLENHIKSLEERCSMLSNENESTVTTCNAKVREYRKKLQFASGRITQLTTESDELEGQIETLSRESSKLREENDRYRRQLGGRFGAESNAQNEMLRKELQSACDEIRELKRQKGGILPSRTNDGLTEKQQNYHSDLASQSTISQLRTEYEETIEALNDEKRELVMRNSAAITDVQKAEMRAWETEKENSALKEELVSLRLQVERLGKNCSDDHQQNADDLTEEDENISTVKSVQFSQNKPRTMHQQDETEDNSNSTGQSTQMPTVFPQHNGSLAPSDEHPPECTQS